MAREEQLTGEREAAAWLRQAHKSDVLGQLRGGIAHDFNNLMTVIIGFSELLLAKVNKGNAPADFQDPLTEIKASAEKATLLTQQILALGRNQLLQMANVDLNELVTRMEQTLVRVLGAQIRVTKQLAADLPLVLIDPVQFQHVLLQLAANAREALPKGGEVLLSTRRSEKVGSGSGSISDWEVELSICDTGVTMDSGTLARALEPGFTTKEGAHGMGLPMVESILRQCGGAIRLESELGRGTKAIVTLPASALQPKPAIVEPAPAPWEAILLVEDADRARRLLARVLEEAGYKVFQAANGRVGLELCRRHEGKIQLLVTDVIMPEMSGPELVKALRKMKQQPRVLFLSGHTGDELERQGIDQDEYHFLQKPFLGEALLRKVRQVLGSESRQNAVDSRQ